MTHSNAYYRLHAQGFAPQVIYDIGANNGSWTKELKRLWPDANYLLFEPNQEHRKELGDAPYYVALSDTDGVKTFWQSTSKFDTGNSLYRELTNNPFQKTEIACHRLDSFTLPPPDLMKLDTQGSELDILRGAKKALAAVEIIQLECSLHHYNEGAPLMADVICQMRDWGFIPCDCLGGRLAYGTTTQMDFLFARQDGKWIRRGFK